ncbi:hypothetical protein [Chondromyces crocatus]|uniref:PEGA domain-containing protein n=1 Tax=Chondromyces crocatus TaxID=52 RepID=A0A0K1E681_CHOCO|nr:hypothetical protein [Chondromyces crocatus]AKT36364.1 uncharacterized protein CMC5_004770 [Chondromyces crocatus]
MSRPPPSGSIRRRSPHLITRDERETHPWCGSTAACGARPWRGTPLLAAVLTFTAALGSTLAPRAASAQDLAGVVARAREQVENGAYADASKTLASLPATGVPDALRVEAALLETTAALVLGGVTAAETACAKAVVASGYDPEVARDQSPKVRTVCRTAAEKERAQRLGREQITVSDLKVDAPSVAWQPVRISATANQMPGWLRVVARVTSSALEGSFELALAPSMEGPLRGTLDPSWCRPGAKITVELVPQDRHGDLGIAGPPTAAPAGGAGPKPDATTASAVSFVVPTAEAMIALGELPGGALVAVDNAAVKPAPGGRIPVAPGHHTVTLELADGAFASAAVDVSRGVVARVALSPQREARSRTLAWIATGTAVALGSVGGVLMLTADGRRRDIEEASARREAGSNLPAVEYAQLQAIDEERKTLTTVGVGLLIGGGVAAAAAATLWLWPESRGPRGAPASATVGARISPSGVTVIGSF